jgi:myo-inositol-1(or 4)-monophosphatase
MERKRIKGCRDFANETARKAGSHLSEHFGGALQVDRKSSSADMVTQADKAAEEIISSAIRSRYPDHAILGEEGGHTPSGSKSPFTWVIDPLDGTTNFVHGLPIYAVSIALAETRNERPDPLLGVVYVPPADALYSAVRGEGAFRDGNKLHASTAATFEESIIGTGIPYDRAVSSDNNLVYINALAPKVQGIRRLGAAALDMCLVAEGAYDAYWELKVKIWDILAGICIAREAGAVAEYALAGDQLHVLSAGPELYDPLKRELLRHGPHFSAL